MALVKQLVSGSGFTASSAYARIAKVSLDFIQHQIHVTIYVYKDKQSRTDGLEPFDSWTASVKGEAFSAYISAVMAGADPRAPIYTWLKANEPRLSGATDDT